jgi:hypothetical protein
MNFNVGCKSDAADWGVGVFGGEMSLVANGKNISTVCTEYLYIPTNMSICSVGL